jgi:hypothetical protein
MYGPGIDVHLSPFMEGRGKPSSGPIDGAGRRSIYLGVRRNFLSPMLLAFDMPTPFGTMGRRSVSNVPAQALILLNDPFVIDQAHVWATRVLAEQNQTPRHRIEEMYLSAFARPATDKEIARLLDFIDRQGEALGIAPQQWGDEPRAWTDVAHALMNTKEFVFVN